MPFSRGHVPRSLQAEYAPPIVAVMNQSDVFDVMVVGGGVGGVLAALGARSAMRSPKPAARGRVRPMSVCLVRTEPPDGRGDLPAAAFSVLPLEGVRFLLPRA